MASDEAAEGSRSRRRMDPNMYFSLPPLLRPPAGLTDDALDRPVSLPNSAGPAAPVAPRTDEQVEEFLAPIMAVYSPWNALSTPEEQSMLVDSYDYDTTWLEDGHNTGDGEEGASVGGANSSSSTTRSLAPGLESYEDPTPWVERFVRPAAGGRVTGAGGVEMVSTTSLLTRSSVQGAAVVVDMEARTPELRFQRLIQISRQHGIVRTGSTTNRSSSSQRATSPEAAERLSWAIQRSHNSLETARRKKKLDGGNKAAGRTKGGAGGGKDDECGCNSSFECNICLDPAKQPVVTPCGHLFCWPCLYRWLHAHSVHSECPVCKGEVLEVNVTPIYGRGDDDDHRKIDASGSGGGGSLDMPPRPRAHRTQSLRQQLQAADARGIATVVRRLIGNHGVAVRGQPNPVQAPTLVVPASRPRARLRRPQRQEDSVSMLNAGNVVVVPAENGDQVPLPPSADADRVPAAPEQSSSVEQTSASSTAAVIVGEPGSSRRSRPSGSPTTRRTRRRQP